MEAFEPKCVNGVLYIIGVNKLNKLKINVMKYIFLNISIYLLIGSQDCLYFCLINSINKKLCCKIYEMK